MMCYHCNKNEADNRFLVNFMGHVGEVHICNDCLEKFMRYTNDMMQMIQRSELETPAAEWQYDDNESNPRQLGEDAYPLDAGSEFKRRRLLGELRARMREAVDREDYENAAWLRDQIHRLESEVHIYDA